MCGVVGGAGGLAVLVKLTVSPTQEFRQCRPSVWGHHSPHIHVRYAEHRASIEIPTGETLEGSLPSKQMKLVQAWIVLHSDELMADWVLAAAGETPYKIDPLR